MSRLFIPLTFVGALAALAACEEEKQCKESLGGADPSTPCAVTSSTAASADTTCYQKPQICPDLSPVRFCSRLAAAERPASIGLLLSNRGDAPMTIKGLEVRGDTRCSFNIRNTPATGKVVNPEDALVLQVQYDPKTPGDDHVTLVVTTDSENYPELILSMCGKGVATAGEIGNACLECEPRSDAEVVDCTE